MSAPVRIEKAHLIALNSAMAVASGADAKDVEVQFNPESLKVAYANALKTPEGGGNQKGGASQQFVGAGTTKLSVQLFFDVASSDEATVQDVRELTREVIHFITPKEVAGKKDQFVPPILRFAWGSFQFDGLVEQIEETLELFSEEGRPLRATLTLALTQQKIQFVIRPLGADAAPAGTGPAAGTDPLTPAPPNTSVQQMASDAGQGSNWQRIASFNNIDHPRFPSPGQMMSLFARGR